MSDGWKARQQGVIRLAKSLGEEKVQLIGQLCNKPPSVAISAFIESVLSVLL